MTPSHAILLIVAVLSLCVSLASNSEDNGRNRYCKRKCNNAEKMNTWFEECFEEALPNSSIGYYNSPLAAVNNESGKLVDTNHRNYRHEGVGEHSASSDYSKTPLKRSDILINTPNHMNTQAQDGYTPGDKVVKRQNNSSSKLKDLTAKIDDILNRLGKIENTLGLPNQGDSTLFQRMIINEVDKNKAKEIVRFVSGWVVETFVIYNYAVKNITEIRESLNNLRTSIGREEEINNLQNELEYQTLLYDTCVEEKQEVERTHDSYKGDVEEEIKKLNEVVKSKNEIYNNCNQSLKKIKSDIRNEGRCADKLSAAEEKNRAASEKLSICKTQHDGLQNILNEQISKGDTCEAKTKVVEGERDNYKQEVEEAKNKLSAAEEKNRAVNAILSICKTEQDGLQEKLDNHISKGDTCEAKIKVVEGERDNYKQEVEEAKNKLSTEQKKNEDMARQLSICETQYGELQIDRETQRLVHDECTGNLKKTEEELRQVKNQNEVAEGERDNYKQEVEEAKNKLSAAEEKNRAVNAILSICKTEQDGLQEKLDNHISKGDTCEAKIKVVEGERDNCKKEVVKANDDLSLAKKENRAVNAILSICKIQHGGLQIDREAQQLNHYVCTKDKQEIMKAHEVCTGHLKKTQEELRQVKNQNEVAEGERDNCKKEVVKAKNKLSTEQKKNEDVIRQLSICETQQGGLQEKLGNGFEVQSRFSEEDENCESKLEKAKGDLSLTKRQNEKTKIDLNSCNIQNNLLKDELKTQLKEDFKALGIELGSTLSKKVESIHKSLGDELKECITKKEFNDKLDSLSKQCKESTNFSDITTLLANFSEINKGCISEIEGAKNECKINEKFKPILDELEKLNKFEVECRNNVDSLKKRCENDRISIDGIKKKLIDRGEKYKACNSILTSLPDLCKNENSLKDITENLKTVKVFGDTCNTNVETLKEQCGKDKKSLDGILESLTTINNSKNLCNSGFSDTIAICKKEDVTNKLNKEVDGVKHGLEAGISALFSIFKERHEGDFTQMSELQTNVINIDTGVNDIKNRAKATENMLTQVISDIENVRNQVGCSTLSTCLNENMAGLFDSKLSTCSIDAKTKLTLTGILDKVTEIDRNISIYAVPKYPIMAALNSAPRDVILIFYNIFPILVFCFISALSLL
ncbi:hypothetical protein AX774_g6856 [Zancudomyces culisetae]|uniref:Uncharacterized protein n=1 Tax=Zancudomyces culisetae TaxID=1213189 RepID=A0A1R1PFT5_ZANCU|nr:hypothetical protein AX774_g6856 [Zancudomyces culisetae]|eukprot:OMH79722.1 hypothetical protein AX774_g6856 [Zancudomyces culisetae]